MNDTSPPPDDESPGSRGLSAKLKDLWSVEFANLRLRVMLCLLLIRMLPDGRAARLRTRLMRALGAQIGDGTRALGKLVLQSQWRGAPEARLQIGADCLIGRGVILEFGETISIGSRVTLEERAVIITTTHQLGPKKHRAGPVIRNPVTIGDDVKIGANAIILPGTVIGDRACVMPDSVVNGKVAADATVSGIPARPLRSQAPAA